MAGLTLLQSQLPESPSHTGFITGKTTKPDGFPFPPPHTPFQHEQENPISNLTQRSRQPIRRPLRKSTLTPEEKDEMSRKCREAGAARAEQMILYKKEHGFYPGEDDSIKTSTNEEICQKVNIGDKESSCQNPVQAGQTKLIQQKPVNPKPVNPKPVQVKPIPAKPVQPNQVQTKPVPPKPVTPKPVTPKPVQTTPKPVQTTPKPVPPKPVTPKQVQTTPAQAKSVPQKQVQTQIIKIEPEPTHPDTTILSTITYAPGPRLTESRIETRHYQAAFDSETADFAYDHLVNTIEWEDGVKSRRTGFTRKAKAIHFNSDEIVQNLILGALSMIDDPANRAQDEFSGQKFGIGGIYLNWYRDGNDYTPSHSHDTCQLIISLGATRTLKVGNTNFLSGNGDIIVFGKSLHGVPKEPEVEEGRISIAVFLM